MKSKKIAVTIIFCTLISLFSAQEKHEYLTIEYLPSEGKIAISMDGKDFTKENVDYKKHDKSGYNANPLLEKVKEYEAKDWEIITINLNHRASGGFEVYYCFMRKKKDEKK